MAPKFRISSDLNYSVSSKYLNALRSKYKFPK
jgi:hypothetical protein